MQNFHSSSRRGFTLIEMLIVIAIIALLSALIFPALGRAREGARTKVCLSNMKQLGLGFQQYVQDNGRRYPGAGAYQSWNNNGSWVTGVDNSPLANLTTFVPTAATADVKRGAIFSYVKSAAVYVCPSNSDAKTKGVSYSMNCAVAFMSDVRVTEPTDVVILVDEDKNNDGFFYAVDANSPTNRSTDSLTTLHNGGGNLLFADGHAKFYRMNAFPLASNNDATYGPRSIINKWAGSTSANLPARGTPRFHDPQFGDKGSYIRVRVAAPTAANPTLDSCAVQIAP